MVAIDASPADNDVAAVVAVTGPAKSELEMLPYEALGAGSNRLEDTTGGVAAAELDNDWELVIVTVGSAIDVRVRVNVVKLVEVILVPVLQYAVPVMVVGTPVPKLMLVDTSPSVAAVV